MSALEPPTLPPPVPAPWVHFTMPYPFYPMPGNIFEHIRVLTKAEVKALEKERWRRANPRKVRRRKRAGLIFFILFFVACVGVIFKLPDPPPWVHPPTVPTSPTITPTSTVKP